MEDTGLQKGSARGSSEAGGQLADQLIGTISRTCEATKSSMGNPRNWRSIGSTKIEYVSVGTIFHSQKVDTES